MLSATFYGYLQNNPCWLSIIPLIALLKSSILAPKWLHFLPVMGHFFWLLGMQDNNNKFLFDTGHHKWTGHPWWLSGKKKKKKICLPMQKDVGSIPELGRSAKEGIGNPLQYSCLGSLGNQTSQS